MRFKTATLVQVLVFSLVTGSLVALVGLTFSQVRIEDNDTYKAVFSNASGLESRVDVRGRGVTVGAVTSIEAHDGGGVLVTFTVPKDMTLTSDSQLRIRYKNLTGDRYLEVDPGAQTPGAATVEPGDTIGVEQTRPALELDDLFAGFDPLMQALDPDQVNALTTNILAVTQGQADSVETMLANVAAFTTGLSERDELIGSVIDNVGTTLQTFDAQRGDLDRLIVGLDDLTGKFERDRVEIATGLSGLAQAGRDVTAFLENVRQPIKGNLSQLANVSANLLTEEEYVRDALADAGDAVTRMAFLGANASQFNFFLCGARVSVDMGADTTPVQLPGLYSGDARCQSGPGTGLDHKVQKEK